MPSTQKESVAECLRARAHPVQGYYHAGREARPVRTKRGNNHVLGAPSRPAG